MVREKEGADITMKAAFDCTSCGTHLHRFEMGIGFHQTKESKNLVFEEGRKKHKKVSPECDAKGMRIRILDADYIRSQYVSM